MSSKQPLDIFSRVRRRWYIYLPAIIVYKLAEDWMLDWARQRIARSANTGMIADMLRVFTDILPLATWAFMLAFVVGMLTSPWLRRRLRLPSARGRRRLSFRATPPRLSQQEEQSPTVQRQPNVEIRIPAQPNQASEGDLEWIHLEAEARLHTAARAVVSAQLGEKRYALRWPSDDGPKEDIDLRTKHPRKIPLVARSRKPAALVGTTLQPNVCYVTDDQFLIHHNPVHTLEPNQIYRIDVTIESGWEETVTESFWITVPLAGVGPITLRDASKRSDQ